MVPPVRIFSSSCLRNTIAQAVGMLGMTGFALSAVTLPAGVTAADWHISGGGGGGVGGRITGGAISAAGGAGGPYAGAGGAGNIGSTAGGGGGAYIGSDSAVTGDFGTPGSAGSAGNAGGTGGAGSAFSNLGTAGKGADASGKRGGDGGSASLSATQGQLGDTGNMTLTGGNSGTINNNTSNSSGKGGDASLAIGGNLSMSNTLTVTAGSSGSAYTNYGNGTNTSGDGGDASFTANGDLSVGNALVITGGNSGLASEYGTSVTGKGGDASVTVNGNLSVNDAFTLTAGNSGYAFNQGIDSISGKGGNASLTVKGDLDVGGSLTLGAGRSNNATDGSTSSSGGDASLAVSGNLSVANTLSLTAGSSGNGVSGGTSGRGGDVSLTVDGALAAGRLRLFSGTRGSDSGGTPGAAGSITLTANTVDLSAGTDDSLIRTHIGDITLDIGTLKGGNIEFDDSGAGSINAVIGAVDTSASDIRISFNNTSDRSGTTGVLINKLVFGGGHTLNLDQAAGGIFTFGGSIDVLSGTNNILTRSGSQPALTATSMRFFMDNATPGSTLLDAGGAIQTTSATTVSLRAGKPLSQFAPSDKVILVNNLVAGSDYIASRQGATYGATEYLFDVAMEDPTTLGATFSGEREVNQDLARAYGYGIAARTAWLNNAYDTTLSIISNRNIGCGQSQGRTGFCPFSQISASHTKTRTGSHVDNDGVNLVLGGSWDNVMDNGLFTLGLFVEGGLGSYDSYNQFANGNGDTWHYGIGGFARHAFNGGTYLEGSVRTGRVKADFDSPQMDHGRYNSQSWYWGGHAGVGHESAVSTNGTVDAYAKAIWTHQDSDTVTTGADERLHFDNVDSLRSRLGARYIHTFENQLQAYAGAAWEYEFDGKVKSRLDGERIRRKNELKGHSGLAEIGLKWHASRDWTLNVRAEGLFGRREGVMGMLMANYRF